MATRGRPTQIKRQRERARQERQKVKVSKRADAKVRRAGAQARPTDYDSDISAVVPGPQPMADWQLEFFEEEEQRAKEAAEKAAQNE